MPRSERLARLVDIVEDARVEYELGAVISEMDDFLAENGLELEPDLTVDEYLATLEHMNRYFDGQIAAEDLNLTEGLLKTLKKGFKMVFGKIVKVGKKYVHKGAAKYNNRRADKASAVAAKFRAKAAAHSRAAGDKPDKPSASSSSAPKAAGSGSKHSRVRSRHQRPAGLPRRSKPRKPRKPTAHAPAAKKPAKKTPAWLSKRTKRLLGAGSRGPRAHAESTELDETIRAGFKMVFGKLVKLKNRLLKKKTKPGGDAQIFRHDQVAQHKASHAASDSLRKSMAGSKRAMDRYLDAHPESVETPSDDLTEHTFVQYVTQLSDMVEDAGYGMTPPDDATLAEFIENMGLFIEDPESELDEETRVEMRAVFGKLHEMGHAEKAKAKLQGKYKPYRRERSGSTSRGGSWNNA